MVIDDLKYQKTHEWVRDNGDGTYTIGISDHAQNLLGDIVYVELPELGMELKPGNECAVVESVKAASDVYSPLAGEVIKINEELNDSPDLINESAQQQGWIFMVKTDNPDLSELMDAAAYQAENSED